MFGITQSNGVVDSITQNADGSTTIVVSDLVTLKKQTIVLRPTSPLTLFYQHGQFKGVEF